MLRSYNLQFWCGGQVVRRQSAKLIFVGSIPARTYFYKIATAVRRFLFWKNGRSNRKVKPFPQKKIQ